MTKKARVRLFFSPFLSPTSQFWDFYPGYFCIRLLSRLGALCNQFLELGLGYFCIGLSNVRGRVGLCLEFVKRNIDQAAEFLLVGLIIGYIWCMYSRYFKMVANDMIQACTAKL